MKQAKAFFYKKSVNIDDIRERTDQEWQEAMDKIGMTASGQKKLKKLLAEDPPRQTPYIINKIVLLTAREYDKFANNLLKDHDFLIDNKGLMYHQNDTYYCLAVACKSREWVILVDDEGMGYARYTAKVPKGGVL